MAKGKYQEWLTPDGLLLLEAWARNGLTDEQIAANMGIDARTLYRWKKQHGQICHALKKGKEVVDIQVENALFKGQSVIPIRKPPKKGLPNTIPKPGKL